MSPREEEVAEARLLGTDWLESDRRVILRLIECSVLIDVLQDHAKHKAVVIAQRNEERQQRLEAEAAAAEERELERKKRRAEAIAEGRAPPSSGATSMAGLESPRSPLGSRASSAGSTKRIEANERLNVRIALPGVMEEDEEAVEEKAAAIKAANTLLSSDSDSEEEVMSRDTVRRQAIILQRRAAKAQESS